MSEYKRKIFLGAVLAVIIVVGLAAAVMPVATQLGVGISTSSQQSSANASTVWQPSHSIALQGVQSVLIVQLTDPSIVPQGTTSLNLTYSAINLLVTEPSTVTTTTTRTSTVSQTSTVTVTYYEYCHEHNVWQKVQAPSPALAVAVRAVR